MDFAESVAMPDYRLATAIAMSMPMAMRVVVVSVVVPLIARVGIRTTRSIARLISLAHSERHKIALRP
jgi:hypothetical protein